MTMAIVIGFGFIGTPAFVIAWMFTPLPEKVIGGVQKVSRTIRYNRLVNQRSKRRGPKHVVDTPKRDRFDIVE